jgi:hypothetical protein
MSKLAKPMNLEVTPDPTLPQYEPSTGNTNEEEKSIHGTK